MQNRLKILEHRLLARGLPISYVHLLTRELQEHLEDALAEELAAGLPLVEAQARANRRIGGAEELAQVVVEQFQQRTFLGRHPVVSLLALTVGGLPLLSAGFLLIGIGGTAQMLQWLGIPEQSNIGGAILAAISHLAAYWICAVAAACCYLIGRAKGLRNAWTWTTCGLMALIGSFNHVSYTAANSTDSQPSLLVAVLPSPNVFKMVLVLAIVVLCETTWKIKRRVNLATT